MNRRSIVLALLLSSAPLRAQTPRPEPIDFSAARELVRAGMAHDSVPAVAVAVARGDSILWEEGFGLANRERRVAATAHTPFYLASVTKTITATAAMLMVDRGALSLDRPANDYLRQSKLVSPAWDVRGATVRRLATHTSGLATYDLGCAFEHPDCAVPPTDELLRRYGVVVWPPGEQFDYSNFGYLVLGDIVARVARRDLRTFLRDELFRPLGMRESSLGPDPARTTETAVRYSWTHGPLPHVTSALSGGSSAYASAHDLALVGMLHAETPHRGSRTLLSDASIDAMQTDTVGTGGDSRYGLGWWVEPSRFGYRSLLAQGGTDAASAWLRVIPSERIVVVVLANKGVGFLSDVVDAAISALLPRYAEGWAARRAQSSAPRAAPVARQPSRIDSALVGTWRGVIRAEGREHPIAIDVADTSITAIAVDAAPRQPMGRVRSSSTSLRVDVAGDLDTPDSTDGRRIALSLRLRDGVLNGALTTRPPETSMLDGRVTYWVELRKMP
jgi:CubicO group peptidase (beta-lactamase class C family)